MSYLSPGKRFLVDVIEFPVTGTREDPCIGRSRRRRLNMSDQLPGPPCTFRDRVPVYTVEGACSRRCSLKSVHPSRQFQPDKFPRACTYTRIRVQVQVKLYLRISLCFSPRTCLCLPTDPDSFFFATARSYPCFCLYYSAWLASGPPVRKRCIHADCFGLEKIC